MWKLGVAAAMTGGALLYNAQKIVDYGLAVTCYPRDDVVGNAVLVDQEELTRRLQGKNALVVGGTKGIGRGVARTLASSGANVWVMGRTAGNSHIAELETDALSPKQAMIAVPANLYTKEGCTEAVKTIKNNTTTDSFDYVVFTVGQWPDRNNPNTEKGVNKVLALDVYARFALFQELQKNGLVVDGGRVMNVLASCGQLPGKVTVESAKEVLCQGKDDFNKGGLTGLLSVAGVSADAFTVTAASRYPSISFIGGHPGLVQTNLLNNSNAFPSFLSSLDPSFLYRVTELESGRRICSIMTSPNVKNRGYTFFNHIGQGRYTHELAYNEDFGNWLWDHMERFGEI